MLSRQVKKLFILLYEIGQKLAEAKMFLFISIAENVKIRAIACMITIGFVRSAHLLA